MDCSKLGCVQLCLLTRVLGEDIDTLYVEELATFKLGLVNEETFMLVLRWFIEGFTTNSDWNWLAGGLTVVVVDAGRIWLALGLTKVVEDVGRKLRTRWLVVGVTDDWG